MIIKEKGLAMSYDLVVFEKSIAPGSKAEFLYSIIFKKQPRPLSADS